jgi:acetyl esterase
MRDRPFPSWHSGATMAAMTAPLCAPRADALRVKRVADLKLRGWTGPLRARVSWPAPRGASSGPPALLLFFPDADTDAEGSELAGELCERAGVVLLSIALRTAPHEPTPSAFHDAVAALEWAADHGTELDADPTRLIVAGEGTGAAVAGAMALHARDNWWPGITRQLLIHPVLDAWHPSVPYVSALRSTQVSGVAPATIVASAAPRDGGRLYATRLRRAGVEVDELRHAAPGPGLVADLARAVRA